MRLTWLARKIFLIVVIAAQFFHLAAERARGQDPSPEPPKIIRKSGGVLQGSAINRVEPVYPPLAKAAEVSGSVVVEVTVDEEGKVISARAISGHPLLKDSAVAAARQWTFTPTMLSGVLVKVIGTITFNFNLGESPAPTDGSTGVPGGIQGSTARVAPDNPPARDRQRTSQGRMVASPSGLLAMIDQSGYRYGKVSEGVWEIEATGKNIKEFRIRVTLAADLALLMVKLADRKDVSVKNELLVKLLELNHRFDVARIALSDEMLYARIDVHARVMDGAEFAYAVEQLAAVTDQTYAELKSFIALTQTSPDARAVSGIIKTGPVLVGAEFHPNRTTDSERLKIMGRNPAVDSRPVLLYRPSSPNYTEKARANKVQGTISMCILIGVEGTIKEVIIIEGLPDGLNDEALKSAHKLKFKPAMKDGKPVDFWLPIDMSFNLR